MTSTASHCHLCSGICGSERCSQHRRLEAIMDKYIPQGSGLLPERVPVSEPLAAPLTEAHFHATRLARKCVELPRVTGKMPSEAGGSRDVLCALGVAALAFAALLFGYMFWGPR